ncbi:MAG: formate dehydrogenase accessory sulfurtransferase FdhD, partial [Chloroflexi bacterium]|nr:formate dehydrogenase accessory sulfurtransferase FdhD [Chloroflexota bacterium]
MSRLLRPALDTGHYQVLRRGRGKREKVEDRLAVEEPLEIRVVWSDDGQNVQRSLVVTMRTPGDDFELAAGFLYSEGIVQTREDILDIAYCLDEAQPQQRNVVSVTLAPYIKLDLTRLDRNFFASSSCGVCGKATLESLELLGHSPVGPGSQFSERVLTTLPAAMREEATSDKGGRFRFEGVPIVLCEVTVNASWCFDHNIQRAKSDSVVPDANNVPITLVGGRSVSG